MTLLVQSGLDVVGGSLGAVTRVVGFTVLSFLVASGVAAAYRWYFRQRAGTNISVLAGLGAVALYLNTRTALNQVMANNTELFALEAVVFNTVAFGLAGVAAVLGNRAGDRAAIEVGAFTGASELEGEVSKVVQAVGRMIAVTLPDEIEDIEGYEPVPDETKTTLAGKTFLFPRGLTVNELHDRLVTRLKDDYQVGYVGVELAEDGTIEYFAVGQRVPGLGPTLGPGQGATAVTADPPNAASPGDLVQVWAPPAEDASASRVATAELRGTAGDTTTLALDEYDARTIAGGDYRLVTLPAEPRADREFAGLLRAADETMAAITIAAGSDVDGQTVGDVEATVVAVRPATGPVEAIPSKQRVLTAGETLFVVARPDRVRRLERAATEPASEANGTGDDTPGDGDAGDSRNRDGTGGRDGAGGD